MTIRINNGGNNNPYLNYLSNVKKEGTEVSKNKFLDPLYTQETKALSTPTNLAVGDTLRGGYINRAVFQLSPSGRPFYANDGKIRSGGFSFIWSDNYGIFDASFQPVASVTEAGQTTPQSEPCPGYIYTALGTLTNTPHTTGGANTFLFYHNNTPDTLAVLTQEGSTQDYILVAPDPNDITLNMQENISVPQRLEGLGTNYQIIQDESDDGKKIVKFSSVPAADNYLIVRQSGSNYVVDEIVSASDLTNGIELTRLIDANNQPKYIICEDVDSGNNYVRYSSAWSLNGLNGPKDGKFVTRPTKGDLNASGLWTSRNLLEIKPLSDSLVWNIDGEKLTPRQYKIYVPKGYRAPRITYKNNGNIATATLAKSCDKVEEDGDYYVYYYTPKEDEDARNIYIEAFGPGVKVVAIDALGNEIESDEFDLAGYRIFANDTRIDKFRYVDQAKNFNPAEKNFATIYMSDVKKELDALKKDSEKYLVTFEQILNASKNKGILKVLNQPDKNYIQFSTKDLPGTEYGMDVEDINYLINTYKKGEDNAYESWFKEEETKTVNKEWQYKDLLLVNLTALLMKECKVYKNNKFNMNWEKNLEIINKFPRISRTAARDKIATPYGKNLNKLQEDIIGLNEIVSIVRQDWYRKDYNAIVTTLASVGINVEESKLNSFKGFAEVNDLIDKAVLSKYYEMAETISDVFYSSYKGEIETITILSKNPSAYDAYVSPEGSAGTHGGGIDFSFGIKSPDFGAGNHFVNFFLEAATKNLLQWNYDSDGRGVFRGVNTGEGTIMTMIGMGYRYSDIIKYYLAVEGDIFPNQLAPDPEIDDFTKVAATGRVKINTGLTGRVFSNPVGGKGYLGTDLNFLIDPMDEALYIDWNFIRFRWANQYGHMDVDMHTKIFCDPANASDAYNGLDFYRAPIWYNPIGFNLNGGFNTKWVNMDFGIGLNALFAGGSAAVAKNWGVGLDFKWNTNVNITEDWKAFINLTGNFYNLVDIPEEGLNRDNFRNYADIRAVLGFSYSIPIHKIKVAKKEKEPIE